MELEKISKARDIECWISNDNKWTYKRYRENVNEAKPGERSQEKSRCWQMG